MVIDKLKLTRVIKIGMLIFYFSYFIFYNTSFNIYLPIHSYGDAFKKKILMGDSCILIVGGSNVRQGVSAKILSERICTTLNLGLTGEIGGFDIYINWLKGIFGDYKYDYIIYSPALFWSQKIMIAETPNLFVFPEVSVLSQLKNFINYNEVTTFNSWGDLNNFKCSSNFVSFEVDKDEFISASNSVVQELIRRISVLKSTTKINKLYLRVPPVYVKTKRQSELYENLIAERIKILKELGVEVVGSTVVSTDSGLFCDSFHANSIGREVFTKEIKLP